MNEKIEKTHGIEEAQKQPLSRREALKALAAASGALAVAFLPGEWTKPVVEAGVLPAHAQGSCSLIIDALGFLPMVDAVTIQAYFSYTDPNGRVSDSATLFASTTDCGVLSFNGMELSKVPATRTGNGMSGKISFDFEDICSTDPFSAYLTVQLSAGGCLSNRLTASITPPYPTPD